MFDYFDMVRFNELSDKAEIYFEEKNNTPEECQQDKLGSKGLYEEVRMHNYPVRGRSCIFYIMKGGITTPKKNTCLVIGY